MNLTAKLSIRVRPSDPTNDFEVVLEADGNNIVDWAEPRMMGLDPTDLLVEPCPLRADQEPHRALIGRCGCGVIGCGSVEVEIRREGGSVIWQAPDSSREIKFAADQYAAEVERALGDFSWETPDRTAAREISRSIDKEALLLRGFKFDWASGRCKDGMMTVSLRNEPRYHQVLVSLPWDGRDIQNIVERFQATLASPPDTWPNVERYGSASS